MYIDFDENRPETPRVPAALTRLERLLLAVVAYQALLLGYFLTPQSFWARPIHELLAPDEPIRYVQIEPRIDRRFAFYTDASARHCRLGLRFKLPSLFDFLIQASSPALLTVAVDELLRQHSAKPALE
jgi:hypothetical protein